MVLAARLDAVIIALLLQFLARSPGKGRSCGCLENTLVRRAEEYTFPSNGRRWEGNLLKITPLH